MSGCAPRALEDSVRPRRLSGVVVRPLNFTVRRLRNGHAQGSRGRPLRSRPLSTSWRLMRGLRTGGPTLQPVSSVDEQRLLELIAGSQTVSAIKLLHELTGYSLGDSTRIVEHMYTSAEGLRAGGATQPSNNRWRGP